VKKLLKILLFFIAVCFFTFAFVQPVNMVGNWYQQFLPSIGGRTITDITFTDSLNGYAIVNRITLQDTSFILRTTNSGDNWFFVYSDSGVTYNRIQFINQNTGFVGGRINKSNIFKIAKTTNAGANWFYINAPFDITANDISVLSGDTIWLADASAPTGGVYRTVNGGANWQQQLFLGNSNPNHVYFYNGKLGFIGEDNVYLRRTSDGGANWSLISGTGGFTDMHFTDTLTGWKTSFQKTTNGGLNWVNQQLPQGGNFILSQIDRFSVIGDTIWGVGGSIFLPGQGNRGVVYRSTNSGTNWTFQVPDTAIHIGRYLFTQFTSRFNGWAYTTIATGVHTTNGGDPVWYTPVQQTSTEVPEEFILYQNYPNPFNPKTNIKYSIKRETENVKLVVYDIQGRETAVLVNERQSAGTYQTDFNASHLASGVYFYSLIIDGAVVDTKKMLLVK
jgi:photosystem II stability/assembly factor-like uncharacterized protein